MGKIIPSNGSVNLSFTESFEKKLFDWVYSLPFDVYATSGFRSIEKQDIMRIEYEKNLALYDAGKLAVKPSMVNRGGYSSHNWKMGVDLWPKSYSKNDIQLMRDTCKTFGIKNDAIEAWHFQDDMFNFDKAAQWLLEYKKPVTYGGLIIIIFIIISWFLYRKFK